MTTPATPVPYIQAAIYARLTGDATLTGLVTGVFDDVPEKQAHPYVVLGEAIETPRNWHGGFGREVVETLHVWSRSRGFSQGLAIAQRITTLLDHQPMTLAGGHLVVSVRHELTQTLRDPDPEIRHLPVRFRLTTEQEQE